jgi:hypothetical protein
VRTQVELGPDLIGEPAQPATSIEKLATPAGEI